MQEYHSYIHESIYLKSPLDTQMKDILNPCNQSTKYDMKIMKQIIFSLIEIELFILSPNYGINPDTLS